MSKSPDKITIQGVFKMFLTNLLHVSWTKIRRLNQTYIFSVFNNFRKHRTKRIKFYIWQFFEPRNSNCSVAPLLLFVSPCIHRQKISKNTKRPQKVFLKHFIVT